MMSCTEENDCKGICATPVLYETWHKSYIKKKNVDNKLEPP